VRRTAGGAAILEELPPVCDVMSGKSYSPLRAASGRFRSYGGQDPRSRHALLDHSAATVMGTSGTMPSGACGGLPLFYFDDHPLAEFVVELKFDLFIFLSAEKGSAGGMPH
jgi:hypothetical protein